MRRNVFDRTEHRLRSVLADGEQADAWAEPGGPLEPLSAVPATHGAGGPCSERVPRMAGREMTRRSASTRARELAPKWWGFARGDDPDTLMQVGHSQGHSENIHDVKEHRNDTCAFFG